MKLFKEGLVRIDCGSVFHNFEAEYEKERSYNAVRDLGTERSPFSDDLKERVWVSDTGLSRPDIYAGVKLFSALYVNTALLYIKRLGTKSHSSLSNMIRACVHAFNVKYSIVKWLFSGGVLTNYIWTT